MLNKLKSQLSRDTHLNELIKGSAITFILKIGGMILGYLVVYLISKKNGASGVGYYSLINQTLIVLGVFSTLGTTTSVLRFIGQFNKENHPGKLKDLYASVLSLVLPTSIFIGGLFILLSSEISQRIFNDINYQEAVLLSGLALPFFAMNNVHVEFIRGLKKLGFSESYRSVTRPLVVIIMLLIFWNDQLDNIHFVYFLIAGIIVTTILSSGFIIRFLLPLKREKSNEVNINKLFQVSFPMFVTGLVSTLMTGIAFFLIEYIYTTEDVGIYGIALRISQLIAIILIVVNTIAAPKFSELYWAGKMDELQLVINHSAKLMFWTALIISIVVVAGAIPILNIFGSEFKAGYWMLIVLTVGQLFNAATGSVGLLLNMSGNQKILRNTSMIAIVVQLLVTFIAIEFTGSLGVAIGVMAAGIIWNLLCIIYVKRKLNLKTYYFPIFRK